MEPLPLTKVMGLDGLTGEPAAWLPSPPHDLLPLLHSRPHLSLCLEIRTPVAREQSLSRSLPSLNFRFLVFRNWGLYFKVKGSSSGLMGDGA